MTKSAQSLAQQYDAIDEEAVRLVSAIPSAPEHARAVFAALSQHQAHLPIVERCPYCSSTLSVTELSETAWRVNCSCGKVDTPFRGL